MCYSSHIFVLMSLLFVSWPGLLCSVYTFVCNVCAHVCTLLSVYVVCDSEDKKEKPED